MYRVQNKTVMITGAATGLGYKYAEALLRNGARSVAVIDLASSNGQDAVAALEEEFGKGRAIFFACDVSKGDELKKTINGVISAFQGLDVLINNAGIFNEKQWERMIEVNINGLIHGSLLAFDYMSRHKGGKGGVIVNISSIAGLYPASLLPMYSATKHAVVGFSQSLALLNDKTGIRVLTLCPGVTITAILKNFKEMLYESVKETIDNTKKDFTKLPVQETDVVARAMIDLIQKGKNGDVWVSEGGQPSYAVECIHYSKRSFPV